MYNKKTWVSGEKITKEALNNIENGITEISEALENLDSEINEERVQEIIDEKVGNMENLVTEEELIAKGYLTEHQDLSNYATKNYVNTLYSGSNSSNVPSYVTIEAQKIADKIIETRNAYSLVISSLSDLHTNGGDTSATGILHAFQGINEIDKVTSVDLVSILGDVMVGKLDNDNESGFKYLRTCMNEVTKNIPLIHVQGNHDELSTDTTEEARQKYFRYIGANNENVVTDFSNRFRNYGYKDFDDLRIRFIYLNSSDVSDGDNAYDCYITDAQYEWFINVALNFDNKEGSNDWQFIVACHHPLNWNTFLDWLKQILQAHKSRTSGSFTTGYSTINYDFTNAKQNFICHLHGHIHNFRTEWFDDVLSITVPNACFDRNNNYGTHYEEGSDMVTKFGDVDENGAQRQFNKTVNSVNDTAFVTFVIDSRINNKIYAYCYGSGIDREIDLANKTIIETEKDDIIIEENESLIFTSIDAEGNIYNGSGYKEDYRIGSTGIEKETEGSICSGYIKYSGQPISLYSVASEDLASGAVVIAFYDDDFAHLGNISGPDAGAYNGIMYEEIENGRNVLKVIPDDVNNSTRKNYLVNSSYIRVTVPYCPLEYFNLILSINMELDI